MSLSSTTRNLTLLSLFLALACQAQVHIAPAIGGEVLDGDAPHIVVTGLRPAEIASVHAFRTASAYTTGPAVAPVIAHAQAKFTADSQGRIDLDTAVPLSGTWTGADPLGLLWSGTRLPLEGDPTQPITTSLHFTKSPEVVVRVEAPSLGKTVWVETRIRLTDGALTSELQEVSVPGLNGAFARPHAPTTLPLPTIILLHGSEGGSVESARATAIRFANLGYAALAVNYFAWPYPGITGVPQYLVDIPVEQIHTARDWLLKQPGVDATHVALWGVSKGAEFALVAAAHYPWVSRVVACVPSDVIWSGFGRAPTPGEVYSSWSIDGKGLPYIPYDNYQDALDRKYSAAFVHQRSYDKATSDQRAAARIPIERSTAKILLLAATNDVVWPSAIMTQRIESRLHTAPTSASVSSLIFPNASHFICGTGTETRRINPVLKPEGNSPTPEADANAAATGWKATKAFLQP